ncbi:MAG: hypothetical protein EKK41_24105 [Hyphomicrobiales bacterium]|nr:MAG: hypothetical protein EKK41_24105 [Hyphomicrobiales bacterium]
MAEVTKTEPQSANDYDDRTTAAVKATLVEIGQILGSYQGKFAIIGGSVPWLLLDNKEMPHVGTVDVDLGLDHEALAGGEYAGLVEQLMKNGYEQRTDLKRFQLVRTVPATDGGAAISVIVDFLMPRDADVAKNEPVLIENFAVQKASGADLALKFNEVVAVSGKMPDGGTNKVEIAVASIPALLAMKGFAVKLRKKHKDAYDIYYCVRNYPGGIEALAKASMPLLEHASGKQGFAHIAEKFDDPDGFGPTCVRLFVEETKILGERTAEQWQQDAYGQVNALLQALGLAEQTTK